MVACSRVHNIPDCCHIHKHQPGETSQYVLYLCFENTGAVSLIPNGGDINMIPIKDPQQVINVPTTTIKDEEIFGGGFFNKIKKGLSVANNFLKSTGAISKLGKYIPYIGPAVSTVASALGYGISGYGDSGGALNYSGGALNIRDSQCVPGLNLQVSISLLIRKTQWEKDCFKLV